MPKKKHAASNPKHQKAVVLRTQWLKDNPDKKKENWDYALHLKEMNKKFTVKFKEEKPNTLTRFLTQPSGIFSPSIQKFIIEENHTLFLSQFPSQCF